SDRGAGPYDVVQVYDVAGAHPDASITCRRPDEPFLRRTMDVNISRERVGVLRLQSTQPENSSHDWITARRIRGNDLAGTTPIFENRAGRRIVADFFRDLQFTQWRITASAPIA